MSFHPKPIIVALKAQLAKIDPAIYLYGEGWNFGPPANNALFVQASQANMLEQELEHSTIACATRSVEVVPSTAGLSLVTNQGFINGLSMIQTI